MPDVKNLEEILRSLVGSNVVISYIHPPNIEEDSVTGLLEEVSNDVIQVKEQMLGSTVWLNRHHAVLTTIRLLQGKKRRGKKP